MSLPPNASIGWERSGRQRSQRKPAQRPLTPMPASRHLPRSVQPSTPPGKIAPVCRSTPSYQFRLADSALINWLGKQDGVAVYLFHRVSGLNRGSDSRWHVHVQNKANGAKRTVNAKFVFLGAGGGALPLQPGAIFKKSKARRRAAARSLVARDAREICGNDNPIPKTQ
jgi:glycerol-3-phosphate dehydrogenase